MKKRTFEVVIDRGSEYYEVEALTSEEAEELAYTRHKVLFPDEECDFWVGDVIDIVKAADKAEEAEALDNLNN